MKQRDRNNNCAIRTTEFQKKTFNSLFSCNSGLFNRYWIWLIVILGKKKK